MVDSLQTILADVLEGGVVTVFDYNCYIDYKQAAHCVIYSLSNKKILNKHPARANVLMTMRFDGTLGFPGGLINKGENIIDGLNRELREEINLDTDSFCIHKENHLISLVNHSNKICFHFFYIYVSPDEFHDVEKQILYAEEYGDETLGLLRVPLYTYKINRGFPSFLQNNFIENAKYQLLYFLGKRQIFSVEELSNALKISN